jgi:hypothetical protein
MNEPCFARRNRLGLKLTCKTSLEPKVFIFFFLYFKIDQLITYYMYIFVRRLSARCAFSPPTIVSYNASAVNIYNSTMNPANARQRMELWVLIFLYGVPEQPAPDCRWLDFWHKTKAISGRLMSTLWWRWSSKMATKYDNSTMRFENKKYFLLLWKTLCPTTTQQM